MMATVVGTFTIRREAIYVGDVRTEVRILVEKVLGYAADPDTADRADGVALAADELFANAVKHGAGGDVEVRVLEVGRRLRIEVRDAGTGPIEPADEDPMGEGGRGLFIVQALTDKNGITQDRRGTTAWFETVIR